MLIGVSSVVFQLALTAMASRSFDAKNFSVWTLALSMAGLTPLFAVNLSAVVTRQLVPALATLGSDVTGVVMAAARRLGRGLAALAVMMILVAGYALHRASPTLAATSTSTFILAVFLLTFGQLWQITIQPTLGWHYAREQNWPVAGALVVVRLTALVATWVATQSRSGDLLYTALLFALGHWVGIGAAYKGSFGPRIKLCSGGPGLNRQVLDTALLLRWFAIWSLGMAAIQYGLPQLMSILGAANYNAFYLAYSLNLVLSGVVGAIGSAMLAPLARLGATGDRIAISQSLIYLPMLIALLLVTVLVLMRLAMPFLVTYWSHSVASATDVNRYLFLLGFQTIARSLSVIFGIVLASRATALRLVGPTLLEIAIVLFVAVPLGHFFGERAFLLALGGAGLAAALALVVVGILVAGLDRSERRRVMVHFAVTESVALGAWWLLAN